MSKTFNELLMGIEKRLEKLSEDDVRAFEKRLEIFTKFSQGAIKPLASRPFTSPRWFPMQRHAWESNLDVMSRLLLGEYDVDHDEGECLKCDLARLEVRRAEILREPVIMSPESNLTSRLTLQLVAMQREGFEIAGLANASPDAIMLAAIEAGIKTLRDRIANAEKGDDATWSTTVYPARFSTSYSFSEITEQALRGYPDSRPDMLILDDVDAEHEVAELTKLITKEIVPQTARGVLIAQDQAASLPFPSEFIVDIKRPPVDSDPDLLYTVPEKDKQDLGGWIHYTHPDLDQARMWGIFEGDMFARVDEEDVDEEDE